MLRRTIKPNTLFAQNIRFFAPAHTSSLEPRDILVSYQRYPNYYALIREGFTPSMVADHSAAKIKACERLFKHEKGVEAYKLLLEKHPDWLKKSPKDIKNNINDALSQFPRDPDEEVIDKIAATISRIGK